MLSNQAVSRSELILLVAGLAWGLGAVTGSGAEPGQFPEATRDGVSFFERNIRPLLAEKCYRCHGPEKAEAGVRLDSRDATRRGGEKGAIIIPGEPTQSRLIKALRESHADIRMRPPLGLVPSAMASFETWVRMGAPDPRGAGIANGQSPIANGPPPMANGQPPFANAQSPMANAQSPMANAQPPVANRNSQIANENPWSFRPVTNPPIPAVKEAAWPKEPLDHFVLSDLEKRKLQPPKLADRAVLIRRASFDLTGLPPTPEEIDAFLADSSPRAFEKVVDRLLGSAHFGEHWGRAWLKLARYADSAGMAGSTPFENAWRYRDYVIAAFNEDKPFDAFVREQLAGDLMPGQEAALTRERIIATGFLAVGNRFVVDPRGPRLTLDIADDQVDLTTRAFLGLTVSCARCHDHKSDPISTRDYYALAGIFTSTATLSEGIDGGRWGGLPRALERSLATPEQLKEISQYEARFAQLKDKLREAREMRTEFPGGIDSTRLTGVIVDNLAAEIHGAWKESSYSTNFVDRNYLHDGDADKGKKTARFVPDLPSAGLYEVLVSYTPRANRATNVPVTISTKAGPKKVFVNQTLAPTVDKVFVSLGRFNLAGGTNAAVLISNEGTKGFVVVDAVRFVPAEQRGEVATRTPFDDPDPEAALLNYHDLERQVLEFQAKRPVLPQAMAVQDGKIRDCRLRARGDPNAAGDPVPRGFLTALGTPDSTAYAVTDESSGRLELANWLVNRQNPLTARVAVNRVWLWLFGKGLVETPDDFGALGARPDNPALLDYLAERFMDDGWSWKRLIRSIMLSSTYQMGGSPVVSGGGTGPDYKMLLRVPRRQLEPEVIRDAMLAVSGQLDRSVGGSWMPTNSQMDAAEAIQSMQTASRRRSVYLPIIRDARPDLLRTLEFSDALTASSNAAEAQAKQPPARNRERFLLERARAWTEMLLRAPVPDESQRIALAYRQALGRTPSADEVARAMESLRPTQSASANEASRAAKPTLTGWEDFCQTLLNSAEFRRLD